MIRQDESGARKQKEKREWIRQLEINVIDPETRHISISILYMAFAMTMLLHHIYVMLYLNKVLDGSEAFQIPWIIFAIISIILGRMWKDKGFWLFSALLILRFLRLAIPDFNVYLNNNSSIILGSYAFFGCYSVGRVLGEKNRKSFLRVFCAVWTIAVTALSALGIYAAWNNLEIYNLGGWKIFLTDDGRLRLIYYPVTSGMLLSASIAVTMIAIFMEKKVLSKVLYTVAVIILLLAQLLTAARVSYITTAAETSAIICVLLFCKIKGRISKTNPCRKIVAAITIIACFTVLLISFTYLQLYMVDGINAVYHKGSLLGTALAETTEQLKIDLNNRKLDYNNGLDSLLTGRITIWKQTFQAIGEDPTILVYGLSSKGAISAVNRIRAGLGQSSVAHCHNVLLQTLLEDGLPGLFLYLGIIFVFFRHGFRLLKDQNDLIWKRFLPLPVFGCLLGEMVDNTTHVSGDGPQMTIMYLFIGLTVAASTFLMVKTGKNNR